MMNANGGKPNGGVAHASRSRKQGHPHVQFNREYRFLFILRWMLSVTCLAQIPSMAGENWNVTASCAQSWRQAPQCQHSSGYLITAIPSSMWMTSSGQ